MTNPQPLGRLLRYLNVPPARRGSRANALRAEDDSVYSVQTDFWLPMRQAIATDRRTTRDGSALHAVARNASSRRRACYESAAQRWNTLLGTWAACTPTTSTKAVIVPGGLPVSVRPTFTEIRPNGEREAVLVWLTKEELSADAVTAAQCALVRAFPACVPVVVDLPRGAVLVGNPARLAPMDAWLDAEAAGLAHLMNEAA